MKVHHDTVLVTAATGRQGGATARALLAEGRTAVRALVRDPDAPRARALAAAGAELVVGDLDDRTALRAACAGARAVFSMQRPIVTATGIDFSKEVEQGRNLVEAALAEGVATFVHTATSGVGDHRSVEGWAKLLSARVYWGEQARHLRARTRRGLQSWTSSCLDLHGSRMLDRQASWADAAWSLPSTSRGSWLDRPRRHRRGGRRDHTTRKVPRRHAARGRSSRSSRSSQSSRLTGRYVAAGTIEEAVATGMHPGIAHGMTYMNVAPTLARPESRARTASPGASDMGP